MICKFCGNEISDNSVFCFVCGQQIAAQPADAAAPAADAPQEPPAPEPVPVQEPAPAEEYAAVDPKDVQKAGKFIRFLCFICPLLGAILYMVSVKRGETGKKHSIANATMSGVCFYLAVAMLIVIKKSMF